MSMIKYFNHRFKQLKLTTKQSRQRRGHERDEIAQAIKRRERATAHIMECTIRDHVNRVLVRTKETRWWVRSQKKLRQKRKERCKNIEGHKAKAGNIWGTSCRHKTITNTKSQTRNENQKTEGKMRNNLRDIVSQQDTRTNVLLQDIISDNNN